MAILNAALDRGIRYIDTAWVYSLGQAEERVGTVARKRRAEMWIATKTIDRTRDGALQQLDESLRRLQTDFVDEWRLHHVATMEELDECFASGGAMDALREAKERGLVRHLSISGHTDPAVQIEALRRFPFDSVLFAASPLEPFHDRFRHDLLPAAQAAGAAVIAMKILSGGKLKHVRAGAMRYALSLPASVAIIGCETMPQLEQAVTTAESFTPMDETERQAFRSLVDNEPL